MLSFAAMKWLAALALLIPAAAQANNWNPAGDYIISGQDEPGYRFWYSVRPERQTQVTAFHNYLMSGGVDYVVPTWQLLRTASDWHRCGAAPFEVPPTAEWDNIVQTLRFVRDYVVPAIGPVEAVSAYRNPRLNACAGGARESVHKQLSAVDLVPLRATTRDAMIARLCRAHAQGGPRYSVGLGFYTKYRFHVDSWKFRTWGRNDAGSLACGVPAPPTIAATPAPPPFAAKTVEAPADPLAPEK